MPEENGPHKLHKEVKPGKETHGCNTAAFTLRSISALMRTLSTTSVLTLTSFHPPVHLGNLTILCGKIGQYIIFMAIFSFT
jgi:hypothetical protein